MYLSKLDLNPRNLHVLSDLGNAHNLHRRIMQGFPDEQRQTARADWQVLYRLEPDSHVMLVQSAIAPDWQRLPETYLHRSDTRSLAPMFANLKSKQVLQFRLRANPSQRDNKTRKTRAITRREEQQSWLSRQSDRKGFEVLSADIAPVPDIYGRKRDRSHRIKIFSTLFQGVLQIRDVEQFREALCQGIGRGRSYGCGLLSLAKLRSC